MELNILKPRKALNKAFLKVKPNRSEIEQFKANLIQLLDRTNDTESEEFHKNLVIDFLKKTYYEPDHFINTKGRNDLVIHNGPKAKSTVGVIVEAKKPTNKAEMLSKSKLNCKAFHELVLYFIRERVALKNHDIKYLIATNIYEWFVFDANTFERLFAQNKNLVKKFTDFEAGRLSGNTTDFFYREIAEPFVAEIQQEIEFTYFDIRAYENPLRNNNPQDDNKLIALFKLLSPEHLLKLPFANDSNSLDKRFYGELLHIIGLTETKQGGKKLIERNKESQRNTGSLLESALIQLDSLDKISRIENPGRFGETQQERLFNVALELSITWINRILFLKLLEAQLITYHKGDKSYEFLSLEKVHNYDDLNSLFFQVLARQHSERNADVKAAFEKVPYLNSSLFEPTAIEHDTLFISNLRDDKTIPIYSATVLKDKRGKKRTGQLTTLEYLFEFLNAYDFSSEGSEEIQEENKSLINASVLGLIFEKINGYKDGSFFTPGFITMYMCRETIRKAVVGKFSSPPAPSPSPQFAKGELSPLQNGEGAGGEVRTVETHLPPELLQYARDLRKNHTKGEEILWQLLRNRRLRGFKFRRQHPLTAGYILDFYCAEKKLGIEIDGGYHNKKEQKEYDENRTKDLAEQYSIRIIRFKNEEVVEDTVQVLRQIAGELSSPPAPSPSPPPDKVGPPPLQRGEGAGGEATLDDVYNSIGRDFSRDEANRLINSLKICDPAVGSGHFLVSALNEIIAIKSELKILCDRNGRVLRDYDIQVVNDELIITDEDGRLFEYNPKNKESQRVQEALFHEKQTIIENCLFGVDINPNSVKICRLRLWIELLKNAYYKNPTELETLPNIDINIKCGNSLISRFDIDADLSKALKKSKWSIDGYRAAVDTYRNAQNKEEKREMERLINDIKSDFRTEISRNSKEQKQLDKLSAEQYEKYTAPKLFNVELTPKQKKQLEKDRKTIEDKIAKLTGRIEEIKSNKIYENAFEWRFEFPEVLDDNGDFIGFDVVIGNPPYISVKEISPADKNYYINTYKVAVGQFDLYLLFAELSYNVLKEKGTFSMITSSTYISNKDCKEFRSFLLKNTKVLEVINLDETIFTDARLDVGILSFKKENVLEETKIKLCPSKEAFLIGNRTLIPQSKLLQIENFEFKIHFLEADWKLMDKLKVHQRLDTLVSISRGIEYGSNSKLISKTPFENSFPILVGGDIKKFAISSITGYAQHFEDDISCYKPFGLYSQPRILVQRIRNLTLKERLVATYTEDTSLCTNTLRILTALNNEVELLTILGILNSKLINYYFKLNFNNKDIYAYQLAQIPIAENSSNLYSLIKNNVEMIIELKLLKTESTKNLEAEIDQLVYELYALTEDEIKIVEGE